MISRLVAQHLLGHFYFHLDGFEIESLYSGNPAVQNLVLIDVEPEFL